VANSSRKQCIQQNLYIALGTVKGFHGYLNNLQNCLQRAGYHKVPSIEHMHSQLEAYEDAIRYELRNIK
jgi:hypothetical protein